MTGEIGQYLKKEFRYTLSTSKSPNGIAVYRFTGLALLAGNGLNLVYHLQNSGQARVETVIMF